MGTFVGIVGKTEVPKEHLETYVKQMLTVWKYGGMMQYETVRLYGKNITLIHSPEFDADEWYMICQYNYLENDSWQPCILNQLGDVCTGKVGQHQLRDVMQAARVLVELSSKNDALAHMDGRLFLTDKHILDGSIKFWEQILKRAVPVIFKKSSVFIPKMHWRINAWSFFVFMGNAQNSVRQNRYRRQIS